MIRLLDNLFIHTAASQPVLHSRLMAKFGDPGKINLLEEYLEGCLARQNESEDLIRLGNIMNLLSNQSPNEHLKLSIEKIRGKGTIKYKFAILQQMH